MLVTLESPFHSTTRAGVVKTPHVSSVLIFVFVFALPLAVSFSLTSLLEKTPAQRAVQLAEAASRDTNKHFPSAASRWPDLTLKTSNTLFLGASYNRRPSQPHNRQHVCPRQLRGRCADSRPSLRRHSMAHLLRRVGEDVWLPCREVRVRPRQHPHVDAQRDGHRAHRILHHYSGRP